MKQRGKCVLALCLAFMLTIISMPQTAQAGSGNKDSGAARSTEKAMITHQPTSKEPYIKLSREGASFTWYKAEPAVCLLVSEKKQANQIEASESGNSYNSALEGWEAPDAILDLGIPVKNGDLITVTPCDGFAGTAEDTSGTPFTRHEDGTYTHRITADNICSLRISDTRGYAFWAKVEITRQIPADKIPDQVSDTYSGAPGTVICTATFSDGTSVTSDPLEVPGYAVTTSSGGNGYCHTQIDGKDVSSAAPGQKITIKPEPADSYELDTVSVTEDDKSTAQIPVTDNSFIMPDCPVTVHVTFRRPSCHITLPSGTGYQAVSQQPSMAEYGSSYTFTIILDETSEAAEDFSVTANDVMLTPVHTDGNRYTYTLYFVSESQTIRVNGVKDSVGTKDEKPPEITITLNENNLWKKFMNQISFGTFFNESKKLTISADDSESGIRTGSIRYYLTDQDLFGEDRVYTAQEIEQKIPSWTEYGEAVELPDDSSYVLYAKAEDNSGNISYASTTGIVIDTTAPSVSQMENGSAYYGDSAFTVTDDYLKTVTVDGTAAEVSGSTYTFTIQADNELHTIQATDHAGNLFSCEFYVMETWLRDGISVSGLYPLTPDRSYQLCPGTWTIAGDSTIYEGDCTIYVDESSHFDFKKQ